METRRKILVVDASAHFRDLESFLLSRAGHVITATSAAEALETARGERPEVVVADLQLPGMSGEGFCKEIRSDPDLAATPVILVSGSGLGTDRERAVRAGADDFLTKPIDHRSLVRAVSRFLHRRAVRALPRAPIEAEVTLRLGDEELRAAARNISRAGLRVRVDRSLRPGTEMALVFALPESSEALFATAAVVWESPGERPEHRRVGLRFLVLDRASARRIEAYVNERIPSERRIEPVAR